MVLSELAWLHGLLVGKEPTFVLPGIFFLRRVRSGAAAEAIAPGMALIHHPSADVLLTQPDVAQDALVVITPACLQTDFFVENLVGKCHLRLLAPCLATFRRVNAQQAQLEGTTPIITTEWPNPQGVAIGDAGDNGTGVYLGL